MRDKNAFLPFLSLSVTIARWKKEENENPKGK